MDDCCVLLWWDHAIFFALCSNIRIHDNQNGQIENSPQNVFNNAPPPLIWCIDKRWRIVGFEMLWDHLLVSILWEETVPQSQSTSSTLCPVTAAEFVFCIHSWCWGMNGICERSKGDVFYFLGWHNSKDWPKITTICSNHGTAVSFPQGAFYITNCLFVQPLQQIMIQDFLAEVCINKRGSAIKIMKKTLTTYSWWLLSKHPHDGHSWQRVAIKTCSNKILKGAEILRWQRKGLRFVKQVFWWLRLWEGWWTV